MKKINFTALLIITLLWLPINVKSQTEPQVYLYEGFEDGDIPYNWTSEPIVGDRDWEYRNGGYIPQGYTTGIPPAAYSGNYNAFFQTKTVDNRTFLITSQINLTGDDVIKPVLTFWHAQATWQGTDQLRVYYRINETASWVFLQEYTNPVSDWVQREIILPMSEEVKTPTYQLGFEATSKWGFGICIDEVKVTERSVISRYVSSVSARQTTNVLPTKSSNSPFGRLFAVIGGNSGTLSLNAIELNYTGTSINDISEFKLFITTDSIFTVQNFLSSTVAINGNAVTYSNINKPLTTGDNYIWLCANISENAQHGSTVDFQIPAGGVQFNSPYSSLAFNPSGVNLIEESIVYFDYETPSAWTLNGIWQIGQNTGAGANDPNYAFSGTKVMATNLSGNYLPNILPSDNQAALTNFNSKFYKDVKIRYRRWLNVEYFDKVSVKVSNDNGANWAQIMTNPLAILDNNWRNINHNIGDLATRKEDVQVRFAIESSSETTEYGGWNIDNLSVTGDFIASDVGVINFTSPIQQCGLGSTETVKVIIRNYGGATVSTPFDVGYSLDGGANFTREECTQSINSEEEYEFTFNTKADLSAPGLRSLVFRTFLTNDEDNANNSLTRPFFVFPTVSFPYSTSFELSSANWYGSGQNSTWQWGVPTGSFINTASHGTKAWVTNLQTNYNNNELSTLESPCFNLTGTQYPVLSFDYVLQVEEGIDGFTIEYSIDGGLTWSILNANANYSSNWFDTPNVTAIGKSGWSANRATYRTAKNLLPANAIGLSGVKLRFVFASNATNSYEGVAIDNIKLYELPYDVGITSLVSPTDACLIGNVTLQLAIKNNGFRPVQTGTTIPMKVKVNGLATITETFTLTSNLASLAQQNYTTTNSFNLTNAGFHTIKAFTDLTIDDNRQNDTLNVQVEVYGMPNYTLGSDIGATSFPIQLDAGAGYTSYQWYELPNTTTIIGTNRLISVADEGDYRVFVENSRGCIATDDITVLNSDKDLQVTAILNLANACEHNEVIKPQFTVNALRADAPFDIGDIIPAAIYLNNIEVCSENFTLTSSFIEGESRNFTFNSCGINISESGNYSVKIATKLSNDINKENDAYTTSISTYGLPLVQLPNEVINTTDPSTLELDAGEGFASYLWEKKIAADTWIIKGNQRIFNAFDQGSAWYRITVTDFNGCGSSTDEIYINTKDLGISSLESPNGTICASNEGVLFKVRIQNFGQDVYPAGTQIAISCITPVGEQNQMVTLASELTAGNFIEVTFPEPIILEVGNNFVRVSTAVDGDPNPDNDFIETSIFVKPAPTVSISPSVVNNVFGQNIYTISPTYSADCTSYLWNDGFTGQEYSFFGAPQYNIYTVTVSNSENCSASASVEFVTNDIAVVAIKTPVNACQLSDNTIVKYTLKNNGNKVYNSGSQFNVSLKLNGNLVGNTTHTLSSNLTVNSQIDIDFPTPVNLSSFTSANFLIEVSPVGIPDVIADNNNFSKSVYATGSPSISLGSDREVHAFSEILSLSTTYSTYQWFLNGNLVSTNPEYSANQSGNYSVTVIDFYGCQANASVNLTFFIDDLSLISINSPSTGCGLTSTEAVNVTIKNTGTWTIPQGTTVAFTITHNSIPVNESYTFASALAPNAERSITLTTSLNLSERKTHNISASVNLNNDMVPANNSVSKSVIAYFDVQVTFSPDYIETISFPMTLDPGEFFSYLWSSGATTQTIEINQSGTYSVQVWNEQGCTDDASVTVQYLLPDISISLVTPTSSCSLSASEAVTVRVQNAGAYTFPEETEIGLTFTFNGNLLSEQTIILDEDLAPGNFFNVTFPETVDLSSVSGYQFLIEMTQAVDANASNNTINRTISHFALPVVELGPDQTVSSPLVLDAGSGYASYLWSTGATTQTITVSATGLYSVSIIDINSCEGYDEIFITYTTTAPLVFVEMVSPLNNQCNSPYLPVKAILRNTGDFTLTSGSTFDAHYKLNAAATVSQNVILPTNIAPLEEFEFEFNQTINTTASVQHSLALWTGLSSGSSNTLNHQFTLKPSPTVNIGPPVLQVTFPYPLTATASGVTYLWSTGATLSTIMTFQTGTYWIEVTSLSNSCKGSDTIYLHDGTWVEEIPGTSTMVSVYPNPSSNWVKAEISTTKQSEILLEVFSSTGQFIEKRIIPVTNSGVHTIDVTNYSSGIYLLRFTEGKKYTTIRLGVTH